MFSLSIRKFYLPMKIDPRRYLFTDFGSRWWNPAAEWQSADRCHRIGQKRPCVITRLCIEDSVESRMVMLQEKKANMINGTINNDKTSMEKLTPEDMQFLFRGS